ncbi:MAG: hypothetical protein R3B60_04520 [Candidatus Paceibacterota bacterium]
MSDKSSLTVFDFSTQAGLRSVLAAVRQSELPAEEKNQLKDLVLLYTSGGADESVRITLEKKLSLHQLKPVVNIVNKEKEQKVEEKPERTLSFGSYRPVPAFSLPIIKDTPVKEITTSKREAEKDVVQPKDNTSTKSEPTKLVSQSPVEAESKDKHRIIDEEEVPESVELKKAPEIKERTTNELKPNILTSVSRSGSQEAGEPVTIKEELKIKEPVSVSLEKVVQAPLETNSPKSNQSQSIDKSDTNSSSPTTTKHLNRIREIKSMVNKKVGNPVNLVDINNEVGREYMNALLEAMKSLGGGRSGELEKAMERLEQAYLAVEKAVSEKSQQVSNDGFKKDSEDKLGAQFQPKEVDQSLENNLPKTRIVDETTIPYATDNLNNEKNNNSDDRWLNNNESEPKKSVEQSVKVSKSVSVPTSDKSQPINTENVPSPNQFSSVNSPRVASIAEQVRNLTPDDLPKTKHTSAEAMANPLYVPEVDDGLEQLLSDWPLFKKSGLFGTGPKGSNHPLFKQISGLQIPIILAGRFEGSNQEIRQSITDYMNGWRYEQGIIYDKGETFEVYLRRVIKHILDSQKQKTPARV